MEKRLENHRKAAKGNNKEEMRGVEIMEGLKAHLEEGKNLREFSIDADDFVKYVAENELTDL